MNVYVLHYFKKKAQKTSKTDVDLAEKRYRHLTKERVQ
jgi:phage-related protein